MVLLRHASLLLVVLFVYGSETTAPRATMIERHTNVAARGTTRSENGVRPTQGAFHETIEITHGWTSWFETGFYIFTSIQPDHGWEWVYRGLVQASPHPQRLPSAPAFSSVSQSAASVSELPPVSMSFFS